MREPNRTGKDPDRVSRLRSAVIAVASCAILALCFCGRGRAPENQRAKGRGSIQVNSSPTVASISLDGTNAGKTPLLLANVAAGGHNLRLTKDGYADWDSTVTVTQGQPTTADAVLSRSFGSVQVNSAPNGAVISLDGTSTWKTTPFLFANVAVGEHNLRLTKDGYPEWDSTVTVTQGQTTTVRAMLKAPPDSSWITYANANAVGWIHLQGPERAVRFNPGDSGFGYPLHIVKVSAVFSLWSDKPWPDSSFRFRIYGNDARTLLYQSPVMEAVPGSPGPAVVHRLKVPVLVNSGEFYLAVAPIDASGQPASYGVSSDLRATGPTPVPKQDTIDRHSYTGSPGHWTAWTGGELSCAVLVTQ
jgi:hypothetical protein